MRYYFVVLVLCKAALYRHIEVQKTYFNLNKLQSFSLHLVLVCLRAFNSSVTSSRWGVFWLGGFQWFQPPKKSNKSKLTTGWFRWTSFTKASKQKTSKPRQGAEHSSYHVQYRKNRNKYIGNKREGCHAWDCSSEISRICDKTNIESSCL